MISKEVTRSENGSKKRLNMTMIWQIMNLNSVSKKTVDPPLSLLPPPSYLGIPPFPTAKFRSHPFFAFPGYSFPPIKEGGWGSHYGQVSVCV